MGKPTLSFRNKIFLLTVPVVFLVVLTVTISYGFLSRREQMRQIKDTSTILSQNLNQQLLPFMTTKNYPPLSGFLQNLASSKNVLYARIQDSDNATVAQSQNSDKFHREKAKLKKVYTSEIFSVEKYFSLASKGWVLEAHIPLFEGAQRLGSVQIGYSHSLMTQETKRAIKIGLFAGGIGVLLSLLLSFLTSTILTRPIKRFIEDIKVISGGNLDHQVNIPSRDEIGRLAKEFNHLTTGLKNTLAEKDDYAGRLAHLNINLENLVRERTLALEKSHQELQEAYQNLQNAQTQLVHSEKMASLGQLVAGIAHELNNPISFIYGNMDHLEEYIGDMKRLINGFTCLSSLNPEERKRVEELLGEVDLDFVLKDLDKLIKSCKNGAERTKNIVTALRNFSRLDEAELKEVDVHQGIESTLELLAHEYKNRINIHKDYGQLPKLYCYASQLNQVFMNLLANAAQAIDGKGDVWIKTHLNGDTAIISITDSGRGISEENMKRLFTPFFTTKPVGKGTGLGLSISYGIIKKHDGQIRVESRVGAGTTFTIELPVEGPKKDADA